MKRDHPGVYAAAGRWFRSYRGALAAVGIDHAALPGPRAQHQTQWTAERVTRAVLKRQCSGADLAAETLLREDRALLAAGVRLFGSWEKALAAADLDAALARTPQAWEAPREACLRTSTAAAVLDALRARAAAGEDLRSFEILRADHRLHDGAVRYFGSCRGALRAAGLQCPEEQRVRWTNESIVDALRQAADAGRDLRWRAMWLLDSKLCEAAVRHFGSYRAAMDAAGLDYRGKRSLTTWTPQSVLEALRAMRNRGESVNPSSMRRERHSVFHAARHFFGSYAAALEKAGIDPSVIRRQREWSAEAVLDQLREYHASGVDMATHALNKKDSGLLRAAMHQFGSYRKALAAADLAYPVRVPKPRLWTKPLILDTLRRLHAEGANLRTTSLLKVNKSLYLGTQKHFGSYRAALAEAGLEYPGGGSTRGPLGHWTEELVLKTLRDMSAEGHDLRYRTMQSRSQPLFYAAKELFGSYVQAVKRAGIDYWTMSQQQLAKQRDQRPQEAAPAVQDPRSA